MADYAELVVQLTDKVSGPASQISSSLGEIVGPAGAVAAGIVAIGTAVAAAAVGLMSFAVSATEAKNKLQASLTALGGGSGTIAMIDQLGEATGMTRDALGGMAQKLLAAGVASDKLEGSLKAVAAANALIEGGGEKVTNLLAKLTETGMAGSKVKFSPAMLVGTGVSEQDLMKSLGMTPKMFELAKKQGTLTGAQLAGALTKVLQEKGAGPLQEQALSLTAQWARFKENISKLFEDVDIKPFLEGIKSVLHVFDQSTASGQAMKKIVTGAMNAIFSVASKVFPYIKTGLELMVIFALKVYIAFKPVTAKIKELFDKLGGGGKLGDTVLKLLIATFSRAAGMASSFARWVIKVVDAIETLVAWGKKAKDIAGKMIDGLVDGIKNGTGMVVDAIKKLGSGAMDALKGILGIHSPSAEFRKLGGHVAAGFSQGMSGGQASSGARAMAAQATSGAKSGVMGQSGRSMVINVGGVTINGASGDARELSEQAFSVMLERMLVARGLG